MAAIFEMCAMLLTVIILDKDSHKAKTTEEKSLLQDDNPNNDRGRSLNPLRGAKSIAETALKPRNGYGRAVLLVHVQLTTFAFPIPT